MEGSSGIQDARSVLFGTCQSDIDLPGSMSTLGHEPSTVHLKRYHVIFSATESWYILACAMGWSSDSCCNAFFESPHLYLGLQSIEAILTWCIYVNKRLINHSIKQQWEDANKQYEMNLKMPLMLYCLSGVFS